MKKIKKKYKIIVSIIGIEYIILQIMNYNQIDIEFWIGEIILLFIILLPFQQLLLWLSKDSNISQGKQYLCKLLFEILWICYFGGVIAEIIAQFI